MEHLEPDAKAWDVDILVDHKDVEDLLPLIEPAYFESLVDETRLAGAVCKTVPVKFTYSAMHGVGYQSVVKAFTHCAINVVTNLYFVILAPCCLGKTYIN